MRRAHLAARHNIRLRPRQSYVDLALEVRLGLLRTPLRRAIEFFSFFEDWCLVDSVAFAIGSSPADPGLRRWKSD